MPPRCRESSSAGVRPARPVVPLSRSLAPALVCLSINYIPMGLANVTDENTNLVFAILYIDRDAAS